MGRKTKVKEKAEWQSVIEEKRFCQKKGLIPMGDIECSIEQHYMDALNINEPQSIMAKTKEDIR
jgi:hypothetical protein